VAAFVIRQENSQITKEEVRTWVREKLSHHLGAFLFNLLITNVTHGVFVCLRNIPVPKYVFWVDNYPKTATGKIQKFKLKEDGLRLVEEALSSDGNV